MKYKVGDRLLNSEKQEYVVFRVDSGGYLLMCCSNKLKEWFPATVVDDTLKKKE